jgi:group I intron endonuclease
MHIYMIRNTINSKIYVGATTREDASKRWGEHRRLLNRNAHFNRHLQFSWNKHGITAFEFSVLETVQTIEELDRREIELILQIGTYNTSIGGNCRKKSKWSSEQQSDRQKKYVVGMCIKTGEIRRYRCVNDTAFDGINHKNVGKSCKLSNYFTKTRSFTVLSTDGWVWMYEKDFTLEEINRRRELARRGKVRLEVPVIGQCLVTGKRVEYISACEAGRQENIAHQSIRRCCKSALKTAAKWIWAYRDAIGIDSLDYKIDNYIDLRSAPKKYSEEQLKKLRLQMSNVNEQKKLKKLQISDNLLRHNGI